MTRANSFFKETVHNLTSLIIGCLFIFGYIALIALPIGLTVLSAVKDSTGLCVAACAVIVAEAATALTIYNRGICPLDDTLDRVDKLFGEE